jgi:BRCT domain type II-containing protein
MTVAQNGLTLSLKEAQASLFDNKGNLLEFEEQEDGTFKSKVIESDSYTYTYELNPQPVIVTVSVTKESKEEAKKKAANKPRPATAKEEKEAENYNKSIGSKHK